MSLKERKMERAKKRGDISRSIPEPQKPPNCEGSPEQGGGDGENSGHFLERGTLSTEQSLYSLGLGPIVRHAAGQGR